MIQLATKKTSPGTAASASRSIANRDVALLWGRARGMCSYCRCELILEATETDRVEVIGEMAHIVGHSDKKPRAGTSLPGEQRNKYENLILLCPTHHAMVDKHDSTYSVDDLRKIKNDHEQWALEQHRAATPGVGFSELDTVTKALVGAGLPDGTDFQIVAPNQKLARNGLTDRVRFELLLGLSKAREVEHFVVAMGKLDQAFPDRLKARFVHEYGRLTKDGFAGDALYEAMASFASAGHRAFNMQAAGRVVLAYLFEKCEVFEK